MPETPGPFVPSTPVLGPKQRGPKRYDADSDHRDHPGETVCSFEGTNAEENRRRWLACLNFCRGVTTEVLEQCNRCGGLDHVVSFTETLLDEDEAATAAVNAPALYGCEYETGGGPAFILAETWKAVRFELPRSLNYERARFFEIRGLATDTPLIFVLSPMGDNLYPRPAVDPGRYAHWVQIARFAGRYGDGDRVFVSMVTKGKNGCSI